VCDVSSNLTDSVIFFGLGKIKRIHRLRSNMLLSNDASTHTTAAEIKKPGCCLPFENFPKFYCHLFSRTFDSWCNELICIKQFLTCSLVAQQCVKAYMKSMENVKFHSPVNSEPLKFSTWNSAHMVVTSWTREHLLVCQIWLQYIQLSFALCAWNVLIWLFPLLSWLTSWLIVHVLFISGTCPAWTLDGFDGWWLKWPVFL